MSIVFFALSIVNLDISFSLLNVVYIVLSLISGTVIHSGILIIMGSLSYFFTKNDGIGNLLTNSDSGLRTFTDFPITIYNIVVQGLLVIIVPYAFVNYFPALYILQKSDRVHEVLAFLSPVVAFIVILIAIVIWKVGLRRYCSTGT